jgi:hypothetical protein
MAEGALPTRREAVGILRDGRTRTLDLLGRLPSPAWTTPGLGGGEWSPKDLLGHLASWEEFALDALHAWEAGAAAPIDALWRSVSTSRINRQNVERKAPWSVAKVRREADRTLAELVAAIEGTSEARWRGPVTLRGRKPLAVRLGGILGGPRGLFRHDEAHLPSLRAFVEERAPERLSRGGPRGRSATRAT